MQHLHVKEPFIKACLFVFIGLTAFSTSVRAGLDYYKIFVGKKLIYERYLSEPLSLQSLPLSTANTNETLTIFYYQCQAPNRTGSNRSIVLKDEKGNMLKQWHFANAKDANNGMNIPVKELLQLQQTNKSSLLLLYYTADGRSDGEKLASLRAASAKVAFMHRQNEDVYLKMPWQIATLLFKI